MSPRPSIVLALALSLAAGAISASAQDEPTTASSSDKPQQPAGPSPSAQSPAPDRDKPKAAAKPRRVITNEDIEAEHEQSASANSDIDIGNINDCDAACFEAVRGWANYYIVRSTDWKRDLLHGIDQVTEDGKWQAALYQIARSKSKFCDLNQDKNDAIADMADPRKMTEDEIAIDEAYDRKFEAARSSLNAAYSQADAIMRTYSGIVVSFMNLQKQRAGNRVCVIRYPVMYRGYRVPLDDPDRP